VALGLSDAFCVERHRQGFLRCRRHVDLLFAMRSRSWLLIGRIQLPSEAPCRTIGAGALCRVGRAPAATGDRVVFAGFNTAGDRALPSCGHWWTHGAGGILCRPGFSSRPHPDDSWNRLRTVGSLCSGQVMTSWGPRPAIFSAAWSPSNLGLISRRPPAGDQIWQLDLLDALGFPQAVASSSSLSPNGGTRVLPERFALCHRIGGHTNGGDAPLGESGPLQAPAGPGPLLCGAIWTGQRASEPARPVGRRRPRGVGASRRAKLTAGATRAGSLEKMAGHRGGKPALPSAKF